MTTGVFIAVIGAALLHATWNALVKNGADKLMSMTAIVLGHAPLAIIAIPFVEPPSVEALPYFIGGMLFHFGYQISLLKSYTLGDLTQVYPLARGSAPLIVAGYSIVVLGVELTNLEFAAVTLIGVGIISLALVRRADGSRNGRAAAVALLTGCFIAGYSLVDGLGARLSDSAVGFYAWLAIANGVVMAIYVAVHSPGTYRRLASEGKVLFLVGGSASFVAYSLVVWAFTLAPIALVTALRETSIVFALLIGVFFLKERLSLMKVASTMLTLLGAALLRFAKQQA